MYRGRTINFTSLRGSILPDRSKCIFCFCGGDLYREQLMDHLKSGLADLASFLWIGLHVPQQFGQFLHDRIRPEIAWWIRRCTFANFNHPMRNGVGGAFSDEDLDAP